MEPIASAICKVLSGYTTDGIHFTENYVNCELWHHGGADWEEFNSELLFAEDPIVAAEQEKQRRIMVAKDLAELEAARREQQELVIYQRLKEKYESSAAS